MYFYKLIPILTLTYRNGFFFKLHLLLIKLLFINYYHNDLNNLPITLN